MITNAILLILILQNPNEKISGQSMPRMSNFAFDLTCWKKQLRLSQPQFCEIQMINSIMYQTFDQLANEESIDRSNVLLLMQLWNTATLSILTKKQVKRLNKVKAEYGFSNR